MGFRQFPGANGILVLKTGWRGGFQTMVINGGPFDKFPADDTRAFGVCLREDDPGACDIHLPIQDFSVPQDDEAVERALRCTLDAALRGEHVYVGCMGGFGRTGLFMALLAKAVGEPKPVEFVRKNYTSRAVETKEQYRYVMNFDVTELRGWLFAAGWRKWREGWAFWWPRRDSTFSTT